MDTSPGEIRTDAVKVFFKGWDDPLSAGIG